MKKGKLIGLLGILAAGALALSACGSSSKSAAKNKFRTLDEMMRKSDFCGLWGMRTDLFLLCRFVRKRILNIASA